MAISKMLVLMLLVAVALAVISAEDQTEEDKRLLGLPVSVNSKHTISISSSKNPLGTLLGIFNAAGGRHPTYNIYPTYRPPVTPSCRYWCKTPENQYYCCESGTTRPTLPPFVRPGCCPAIRPECPHVKFGPPKTCSHDNACTDNYTDKCCFDRCLEQHVCKPVEPCYGFGVQ